jgi:hypothetical protein
LIKSIYKTDISRRRGVYLCKVSDPFKKLEIEWKIIVEEKYLFALQGIER